MLKIVVIPNSTVPKAPNIRMFLRVSQRIHQVIAQSITKLGEFFLCGTSCYNFERLRVTKKVLVNLRILGTIRDSRLLIGSPASSRYRQDGGDPLWCPFF